MKIILPLSLAIYLSVFSGMVFNATSADAPPKAVVMPKGAVLRYSFNAKISDAVIVDSSGQKNNGKVKGGKPTTSAKKGNGYQFYSTSCSVTTPHGPSLNLTKFTVSTWFRVSGTAQTARHILDKGNVVLGIGGVTENGTGKDKVFVALNGRPLCFSDYAVTDGTWHHVAATYDGAAAKLFLNGKLQKQVVPFAEKLHANNKDLLIGMVRPKEDSKAKPVSLNGYLDEVVVYNRALSDAEVKDLALSIDPLVGKARYTKRQVMSQYTQLKRLYYDGLITDEFMEKKIRQLEAGLGDEEEPKK